jgi:dTDP-4-amino-4,6-dideoxygalactose transaminase
MKERGMSEPSGLQLPFNRPFATGKEFGYIAEAIGNAHLSGDGPFTKRVNDCLARMIGSRSALLTHSCTAALEMSAMLADVGPGDEVIMPSYTFVSTANAFVLRGATPVFVDIRGDTLNIDETIVEAAITERTRAIVAVHYAGVACEMDTLTEIAQRRKIHLIEDAAQAVGSYYNQKPLGSFGATSALSFHETKNVISGEGGALIINDETLVERAEIIREKGTNRTRFLQGMVDKYTWVDIGSSYLPSEIVAAFLWAQLESIDAIAEARMAIWKSYDERLEPLEADGLLRRPIIPDGCAHNAHMYYVLAGSPSARDDALAAMHSAGIKAIFHYVPLHSSPGGTRYGRCHGTLARTDDLSARLIRLPLFNQMTVDDVRRVCDQLEVALSQG